MSGNEFSVYQWFPDGSYERICSFVSAEEAVAKAKFYTSNVASRMGITQRVIITDGGDCIAWEWLKDTGVVFGEESCETHKDDAEDHRSQEDDK